MQGIKEKSFLKTSVMVYVLQEIRPYFPSNPRIYNIKYTSACISYIYQNSIYL